jgi:peroxin-3
VPLNEMDQAFVLLQGGLASHHAHIDAPLRSLLSETSVFVSSADFGIVLGVCLDRGTAMFLDGLRKSAFGMGDHGQKIEFDEQSPTVRFAALLPAVARWSHLAVNGIPNELIEVRSFRVYLGMELIVEVQSLADMPEMTAFSAVLFSSFSSKLH